MGTFYVIHTPYKNGSWRGMEKCFVDSKHAITTLFETREDAERAREQMPESGFTDIWPIEVNVPDVRSKKREDGVQIIETGDRWAVVKNGRFIGTVLQLTDQWTYQTTDGDYWFPETGKFASREEALERLLEEWD